MPHDRTTISRTHLLAAFKFCTQIRDSARGAPRTIAFARYLEFARASLMETHNHLQDGRGLRYLDDDECAELCLLANRAIGATTNLHAYLKSCKEPPHGRKKPPQNHEPRTTNPEPRTLNYELFKRSTASM